MKRHARTLPLFITMVAMLAFAAPGYGALTKPAVTAPTSGASYNTLPHFSWNPVAGADHYEFQIAADAAFTSSVLGFGQDDFITKNTTATVAKTLPNGTYYWRVRAQSLTGSSQSAWSDTQSFTMAWASTPVAHLADERRVADLSAAAAAELVGRRRRTEVPADGRHRPRAGLGAERLPIDTSATSFSPSARLANGTYYWAVQPIDAEGRAGAQSPIWHFTWNSPTDTSLSVTDLDPSSQVYDPQFSWDPWQEPPSTRSRSTRTRASPRAARSAALPRPSRPRSPRPRCCPPTPTTGACGDRLERPRRDWTSTAAGHRTRSRSRSTPVRGAITEPAHA